MHLCAACNVGVNVEAAAESLSEANSASLLAESRSEAGGPA